MRPLSFLPIFFFLILITSASGVELIFENIDNKAMNTILIPYNDFFFHLEGEEKIYDNIVTIVIYEDDDRVVYQNQTRVSLAINPGELNSIPRLNYNREYYPIEFETELQGGEYQIYVSITDGSSARKRELREGFHFSGVTKNIGYLMLKASLGDFVFIIRDKRYLFNRYDSLDAMQHLAFQPDSSRVAVKLDDEEKYFTYEEMNQFYEVLIDEEVFSIEIEHFSRGRKFVSTPVYPNAAHFFQQKYNSKDQLAQLRYILNQNEYQYLRSLSDSSLQNGINHYWLSKDPDPYTTDNVYQETFYQRVRYADNNYQIRRYLPGWRTDMGRIFIIYGEPDQIISDVFPIGRTPSITWYYYSLNKVFIFYDLRGYGNYELRDKWLD